VNAPDKPKTIDYLNPAHVRYPRRWWLPASLLIIAAMVWNSTGLTPTQYPRPIDHIALGIIFVGAFFIGFFCKLPKWVDSAFGALAVSIFLLANMNDNNFRGNTMLADVLLPWVLYVLGGGILSSLLAWLGRGASKWIGRRRRSMGINAPLNDLNENP